MRLVLLQSLVFLVSCGNITPDVVKGSGGNVHNSTDPLILPYVESMQRNVRHYFSTDAIPANFKEMDFGIAGQCVRYPNGGKEVFINKTYWDYTSEACRDALIYHEYGHCIFNRDHKETSYKGYKTSVMASRILDCNAFDLLKAEYSEELRTKNDAEVIRGIDLYL